MKQKFFAIGAIAVLAIVGVFVFQYATLAQRPDRNAQNQQRSNRQGGERGNRGGMMGMMNYVSLVDNSWIDLSFAVKVEDETLVKTRSHYQAARDNIASKMETLRQPGMREATTKEIQGILQGLNVKLKEILTEEQMAKLNELTKKRVTEMQQRMSRWRGGERGGERGRRGGGGNQ